MTKIAICAPATPITRDHDGLKKPEYLPKTVPLGLHGDGGSFSHQDSLFVLSWNGLLGHMGVKLVLGSGGCTQPFGRRTSFQLLGMSCGACLLGA